MKRYDVKKTAARLQALRASRGYSLQTAAAQLGTDELTLGHMERGEMPCTVEVLAAAAEHYGVPLDFLVLEDAGLPQQQEIDRLIEELRHALPKA